jgi:hypothetical protein
VGKKLESAEGTSDVRVGSMTLKSPTTTTTLEQSGSVSAFGVKLGEHSISRSVATGVGGQQIGSEKRSTNTSNLSSYSNGDLTPSKSGNVGGSAISISAGIKVDVQVNFNKVKSLFGL